MVAAAVKNRRDEFGVDGEFDPSRLLDPDDAPKTKLKKVAVPWALATLFSDSIPPRCGWKGLDGKEMHRAAGYMKELVQDRGFPPDRVQKMITVYADMTRGQNVESPVGYFWSMRRTLARKTEPVPERDYSSWTEQDVTPAAEKSWGWA